MCGIRGRTWSAHYTELQRQPVRTVRTYGTIIGSRSMHATRSYVRTLSTITGSRSMRDRILSCCYVVTENQSIY